MPIEVPSLSAMRCTGCSARTREGGTGTRMVTPGFHPHHRACLPRRFLRRVAGDVVNRLQHAFGVFEYLIIPEAQNVLNSWDAIPISPHSSSLHSSRRHYTPDGLSGKVPGGGPAGAQRKTPGMRDGTRRELAHESAKCVANPGPLPSISRRAKRGSEMRPAAAM